MKSLQEVVETYANKEKNPSYLGREIVSVSARIGLREKVKLQFLSALFGKKQTPLLAELIETSINEIFDQLNWPKQLQEEYEEAIRELEAGQGATE